MEILYGGEFFAREYFRVGIFRVSIYVGGDVTVRMFRVRFSLCEDLSGHRTNHKDSMY